MSASTDVPISIIGLPSNITSVVAASGFSAFLSSPGVIYTVGSNYEGLLGIGDSSITSSLNVYNITSLSSITLLKCGQEHCLAANSTSLFAWGNNNNGQYEEFFYLLANSFMSYISL